MTLRQVSDAGEVCLEQFKSMVANICYRLGQNQAPAEVMQLVVFASAAVVQVLASQMLALAGEEFDPDEIARQMREDFLNNLDKLSH